MVGSVRTTRLAAVALAALALGACDYGLGISPEPAAPGATVTVTNDPDGPGCITDDEEGGTDEIVPVATPIPVDVYVVSSVVDLMGGSPPEPAATAIPDEEGAFSVEVPAPSTPGLHLVVAVCEPEDGPPVILQVSPALDPIEYPGVIVDLLRVGQKPLTISLSDDEVEVGDEVVATFNRCQDENELGILEEIGGEEPDELAEALATDFPDLEVFVDGVLVETIAGDERYPTGTVDVVIPMGKAGEREITGVCTYQTFDIDEELLAMAIEEEFIGGPLAVGTADVDYPVDEEIFVFDEATTNASATVEVLAAAIAPAAQPAPAVAQPTYAG